MTRVDAGGGCTLVLTCEHASHRPPRGRSVRNDAEGRRLRSHQGWDPGAAEIARSLSRSLGAPLFLGDISRLWIDLNRSPHNPAVFGDWARSLSREERKRLLDRHHASHWHSVMSTLEDAWKRGERVLHVAVHSFAPVVRGARRNFDVGLLYDSRIPAERRLSREWQRLLAEELPTLRVRRNQPYLGRNDGLPTAVRRRFGSEAYCGIELELGQALLRDARRRRRLKRALEASLAQILGGGASIRARRGGRATDE
jgi:predicted N-formylglutamate amidohydrolase